MRNTRARIEFLPLATLALSVAAGNLTAQTRFLTPLTAPIDAVVSDAANSVFGFISNTTTGLLDTFAWNGFTWALVTSTGPSSRTNQAMAGAPGGGVMMFGGFAAAGPVSDTWALNGAAWTQLSPATSPSARSSAGCAQLGNGNVVLFGGLGATVLGDTWIFNGTNWVNLNITGPSARQLPAMGSDGNGNAMLFGGLDSTGAVLNDTWLFSATSSTWTQLFPAATPPPRFGAALTADPKIALPGVPNRTSVALASGFDFNATPFILTDVWVFAAGNWRLQAFAAPATTGFLTCAFDGTHHEILFADGTSGGGSQYVVGEFGFTRYGSGCACLSGGVPTMVPSAVPPVRGNTTSWNVIGGVPNAFVFLLIDFAPANIPFSTACTQLVGSGGSSVGIVLSGTGAGSLPFNIPATTTFFGISLFGQMIDAINFCGSNGIEMRTGR